MKRTLLVLVILQLCALSLMAQRYVVNGKEGKIRVVEYELVDGKWQYVKFAKDIYVENGYEFEAVPPVSDDCIVMEYGGKYYHVIWPDKELEVVDDMGRDTHLGLKNKLRNSAAGAFYFSSTPALAGLVLTILAVIVFIMGIFENNAPRFLRLIFVFCIGGITLLELGAALVLGSDAYWWCNPDDVGYLRAIGSTLLFGITLGIQYGSLKMYKVLGRLDGGGDVLVYIVFGLGMVVATIAFIGVLKNFLFAVCCAIFALFFFKSAGSKRNRRVDDRGETYYVDDLGVK